jgi:DNA repair exonuclease SbcCD ATPase subunit
MNVREITLKRWPCQAGRTFELPSNGIVLITGDNGVGKSGLVEAVAWAAWDKTLRGTHPKGDVRVVADEVVLHRTSKLSWHLPGAIPDKYSTKTAARLALERHIGSFDLWRRSAVFASRDLVFAKATDKQRKQLLEQLAGVANFDAGLKSCREDLKDTRVDMARLQHTLETTRLLLAAEERRVADATVLLNTAGRTLAAIEDDSTAAQAQLLQAAAQVRAVQRAVDDCNCEVLQAASEASLAAWRVEAVATGHCSACGRPVEQRLSSELVATSATAQDAKLGAQRAHADAAGELLRAQAQQLALERRLAELRAELVQVRRYAELREQAEAVQAEAALAIRGHHTLAQDYSSDLAQAQAQVQLLDCVEDVLGLRGARTRVLAQVLGALQAAANAYLAQLAPPALWIELCPYTARQQGTVDGAISLLVHGTGDDTSYAAASSGQQRRVDLACLLALGDLAATQRPPGTLWCDEVFDALDPAGVSAAAALLLRLAATRCVVLITHCPQLVVELLSNAQQHLEL